MKRVIVSIMSEQTIPNYLFIKEMYIHGDNLMFIASEKFSERIQWIVQTLRNTNVLKDDSIIEEVVFPREDEERWENMKQRLLAAIPSSDERHYLVNLTGGTKYMSLLVQHVFEQYSSSFAYIPYPKNDILIPSENEPRKLETRVSIREYLSNYNVEYTEKDLVKECPYTDYFFDRFVHGRLDFNIINLLRNYRDRKKCDVDALEKGNGQHPAVVGLGKFLQDILFPIETEGVLTRQEVGYLTGGWFEEYMFNHIKSEIHPQDIALNVTIKRTEGHNQNELDVVFTLGNKLFVIECKTGIDNESMFNGTVYKATAVKNVVLGLSANTFIVSLAGSGNTKENEKLKKTASNMGITYKSREDVLQFDRFVEEIKMKAKD